MRGLSKVECYVWAALILMLLIVVVSHRRGRPERARRVEYYASHCNLDQHVDAGQRMGVQL